VVVIELRNLRKAFRTRRGEKVVADNISVVFPTGKAVALFGRNGAGKSTLLNMISGNLEPDSGEIIRKGEISYPVGFAGSFHRDLTGAQNTRFVARV
jgi:capsular polysaccharide transport system ATP-binding protein